MLILLQWNLIVLQLNLPFQNSQAQSILENENSSMLQNLEKIMFSYPLEYIFLLKVHMTNLEKIMVQTTQFTYKMLWLLLC